MSLDNLFEIFMDDRDILRLSTIDLDTLDSMLKIDAFEFIVAEIMKGMRETVLADLIEVEEFEVVDKTGVKHKKYRVIPHIEENPFTKLYSRIYRQIVNLSFDYKFEQVLFEDVAKQMERHPVFKGYAKIGHIPMDYKVCMVDAGFAEECVRTVAKEIDIMSGFDKAFTVAAFVTLATSMNFIGVGTGVREYSDGSNEEVDYNILVTDRGLMIYEPDKERVSFDGKAVNYYIYCGGMTVWF